MSYSLEVAIRTLANARLPSTNTTIWPSEEDRLDAMKSLYEVEEELDGWEARFSMAMTRSLVSRAFTFFSSEEDGMGFNTIEYISWYKEPSLRNLVRLHSRVKEKAKGVDVFFARCAMSTLLMEMITSGQQEELRHIKGAIVSVTILAAIDLEDLFSSIGMPSERKGNRWSYKSRIVSHLLSELTGNKLW